MVFIAMFTALLAILSPLQIVLPFTPVPITLQIMGISFTACILGSTLGTLSVILYILLGIVGLPVFAGFTSGLPKILGPTGGYITGFILSTHVIGKLVEVKQGKDLSAAYIFFANTLGIIICYIVGSIQLSLVYTHSLTKAFLMGVLPYILPDIIKLIFSSILITQVRKILSKTGYMINP